MAVWRKEFGDKPLASRTVVTSVGGDHVQYTFDTPAWQRRLNDLAGMTYQEVPEFRLFYVSVYWLRILILQLRLSRRTNIPRSISLHMSGSLGT